MEIVGFKVLTSLGSSGWDDSSFAVQLQVHSTPAEDPGIYIGTRASRSLNMSLINS